MSDAATASSDLHDASSGLLSRVHGLLVALALFDVFLVAWIVGFPHLWVWAFHGVDVPDPQALFTRMGANWAAFALIQWVAVFRCRQHTEWIVVVVGVRLSDIFTDITYVLACEDATWFAWATLPLSSLTNLLFGLWLLSAWRRLSAGNPDPSFSLPRDSVAVDASRLSAVR